MTMETLCINLARENIIIVLVIRSKNNNKPNDKK